MKRLLFIILILSVSKSFAYDDCAHWDDWMKTAFCQVTGGIFYAPNYANMKNGIFHNPFQPYTGWGNKPDETKNGYSVPNPTQK